MDRTTEVNTCSWCGNRMDKPVYTTTKGIEFYECSALLSPDDHSFIWIRFCDGCPFHVPRQRKVEYGEGQEDQAREGEEQGC